MADEDVLRDENAYFESQKESLLANHEGQFALVSDKRIVGTYTTQEEAYQAGLKALGNRPFLIRQISKDEPSLQVPALFVGGITIGSIAQ